MKTKYIYELWNGKEVLGLYESAIPLCAKYVIFPVRNPKVIHGVESIRVPLKTRILTSNGVEMTTRIVLDVSRKSQRQLSLLLAKVSG